MTLDLRRHEQTLLDLAYATVLDDGAWERFAASLARGLPDGRATLTLHDPAAARGEMALSHGLPEDFHRLYRTEFGQQNPWLADVAARPLGVGARSADKVPFEALARTAFFQDFLRPHGIRAGVGVTVERRDGRLLLLSVLGDGRDPAREVALAGLFTRLAPHLNRALRLARARVLAASAARHLGAGLDAGGIAALCVGAGRRVLWANAVAEGFLARGAVLRTSVMGQARIVDAGAMAALEAVLDGGAGAAPVTTRVGDGGGGAWTVTVCRLDQGATRLFLREPAALVLVAPARVLARAETAVPVAWQAAGLTAREREVARDLVAGLAPAEIAARRGIGVATVRSHLKQVYGKLGVRRQAELVATARV